MLDKPYILNFGRYKGKALEQIIWEMGFFVSYDKRLSRHQRFKSGYSYLDWLIENHGNKTLVDRARKVKKAADTKKAAVKCQLCQNRPAEYVEIGSNSSGVTIGPDASLYLFCEKCIGTDDKIVALQFSRIGDFSEKCSRQWFIETLKKVFLGDEETRITKDRAFNFLFNQQTSLFC